MAIAPPEPAELSAELVESVLVNTDNLPPLATPPALKALLAVSVHPVTLGTTSGDRVQVLAGVVSGERVVTDGTDKLREGAKVELIEPNAATGAAAPRAGGKRRAAGQDGAGGATPGAAAPAGAANGGVPDAAAPPPGRAPSQ